MQIVFLHALPFGRDMWRWQLDAFAGKAIAPELYHCGPSLTEWAHGAFAECSDEQLILVGNSIGGSCALEIAALAPERVAALVLIGAKAERSIDSALKDECVSLLRSSGFEEAWIKYWEPFFGPNSSNDFIGGAKELAGRTNVEHIANGVEAFHTRSSRFDLLGQLDCPVVCVSGAHDIAPGLSTTRAQARAAKFGRYVEVPDCGHYVPLEKPNEMNTILEETLRQLT